jgi:hypothetical protein
MGCRNASLMRNPFGLGGVRGTPGDRLLYASVETQTRVRAAGGRPSHAHFNRHKANRFEPELNLIWNSTDPGTQLGCSGSDVRAQLGKYLFQRARQRPIDGAARSIFVSPTA